MTLPGSEAQRLALHDVGQAQIACRIALGHRLVDLDQGDRVAARRSRPRWNVAMLTPASPSSWPSAPIRPGLVDVAHVEHVRPELGLDLDAADLDDPRRALVEQRAGDAARRRARSRP